MLAELLIMIGLDASKKGLNSLTQQSKPDQWGVFYDGNDNQRIIPSNKRVYYTYSDIGERVIKYVNGGIAVNIDLENSKKNKETAIKNDNKFFLRTQNKARLGNKDIIGNRYCCVNDDKEKFYVKRSINFQDKLRGIYYWGDFYMDMNYEIVAPTDETIKRDIKEHNNSKDIIYYLIIEHCNNKRNSKDNLTKKLYKTYIETHDTYTITIS